MLLSKERRNIRRLLDHKKDLPEADRQRLLKSLHDAERNSARRGSRPAPRRGRGGGPPPPPWRQTSLPRRERERLLSKEGLAKSRECLVALKEAPKPQPEAEAALTDLYKLYCADLAYIENFPQDSEFVSLYCHGDDAAQGEAVGDELPGDSAAAPTKSVAGRDGRLARVLRLASVVVEGSLRRQLRPESLSKIGALRLQIGAEMAQKLKDDEAPEASEDDAKGAESESGGEPPPPEEWEGNQDAPVEYFPPRWSSSGWGEGRGRRGGDAGRGRGRGFAPRKGGMNEFRSRGTDGRGGRGGRGARGGRGGPWDKRDDRRRW